MPVSPTSLIANDLTEIKHMVAENQKILAGRQEILNGYGRVLNDHEVRLRNLEILTYKAKGAVAAYATLGGLVAGIVVTIVQMYL